MSRKSKGGEGIGATLTHFQTCGVQAVDELKALEPAGSLLDSDRHGPTVVSRIGSLISSTLAAVDVTGPATWAQLDTFLAALGDCTKDCDAARVMFMAKSESIARGLFEVIMCWKNASASATIRRTDLAITTSVHACCHSAIYILLGLISTKELCQSFAMGLSRKPDIFMQFLALPMLLESEIQYSTQEMMLEFVSRIYLYYSKNDAMAAQSIRDRLPSLLHDKFADPKVGVKGVLLDTRSFLNELNVSNPNIVSIRVSNVGLLVNNESRDLGRVDFIDLGLELISFFIENGPVITIKYQQLRRVHISETSNCVELYLDDFAGNISGAAEQKGIDLTLAASSDFRIQFSDSEKSSLEKLRSAVSSRLQSIEDAKTSGKTSVATTKQASSFPTTNKGADRAVPADLSKIQIAVDKQDKRKSAPLSSQKRRAASSAALKPSAPARVEESQLPSPLTAPDVEEMMSPPSQTPASRSRRMSQRSVLETATVGRKLHRPEEAENVPMQTQSLSSIKKRKGAEVSREELESEAPISTKKTRSFGKELTASQLNQVAPESAFKVPPPKKAGVLSSQQLADSAPASGMPTMSSRLVKGVPPEEERASRFDMRLNIGYHEDMGAEEYEEEEVPVRKPPLRRGRELLRAESMESEAEGGDQNAVMALLLQELVSINKSRAQRKKQLQQSKSIKIAIDHVSDYCDGWKSYSIEVVDDTCEAIEREYQICCDRFDSALSKIEAEESTIDRETRSCQDLCKQLSQEISSIDRDYKALLAQWAEEDSCAIKAMSRKAQQLAAERNSPKETGKKKQTSTIDAIKLLEQLK